MMRIVAVLAGMTLFPLAGCSLGTGAVSPLGCRIALGYIKDFKARAGKSIGVWPSRAMAAVSPETLDAFVREQPQYAHIPEIAQFRAQAWVEDLSVVANCSEVRNWLDSERIPHDEARLEKLTEKEPWPVATLSISMPAFTDAGTTASFNVDETWGPLGGGSSAIVYKRGADGRWRMVSEAILAIG